MSRGKGDYNTFLAEDDRDDIDDEYNDDRNFISSNKSAVPQSQNNHAVSSSEASAYVPSNSMNITSTFEYETNSIFSSDVPSTSAASNAPSQIYIQQSQAYNVGEESEIIVPPASDMDNPEVDDIGIPEFRVGEQARVLLNYFLQVQARDTPVEPVIHRLCQVDRGALIRCGLTDDSLSAILIQLQRIADEISENETIEHFIESVPICATQEVFFEVCHKVFEDGIVNWGRVVMVFYFGCRLVIRSLSQTVDNVSWVKDMLRWVVDFVVKHYAKWILSRGGWTMIKEWAKFSDSIWSILFAGSLVFGLWAYFKRR